MAGAIAAGPEAADLWPEGVMPLSRWSKFSSNNLDSVHDHMCRMFVTHQLRTETGVPLSFRHHQAKLHTITLNATDYGTPYGRITTDIPASDEFYFVQMPLAGRALITYRGQSFELKRGFLCILGGQFHAQQLFDQDYKHFTVKIAKKDLEIVLAKELGVKPKLLEFLAVPVKLDGEAGVFAHLVRTICDDLDGGLMAYTHPRIYDTVEEILKRLILASVPHNYSDVFNSSTAGPCPYYLRRVEEFIRHHAADPLSFDDLINASGVSRRALHSSFRRFRNDTPMGYLKKYRLDLAREQLLIGIEQGRTVTDIAFASGFTHLSKFARDYFERFNERPSETLKRMGRGGGI
jgi:AraC-like DNA-binding protein